MREACSGGSLVVESTSRGGELGPDGAFEGETERVGDLFTSIPCQSACAASLFPLPGERLGETSCKGVGSGCLATSSVGR